MFIWNCIVVSVIIVACSLFLSICWLIVCWMILLLVLWVGYVTVLSVRVVVMKCLALWLVCLCYWLYQRSTDPCDHQSMSTRVCIHITCEYWVWYVGDVLNAVCFILAHTSLLISVCLVKIRLKAVCSVVMCECNSPSINNK